MVAYRQDERTLNAEAQAALAGREAVVLPLYSPRSAAILAAQGPFAAPLRVIAISRPTLKAAGTLGAAEARIIGNPDGREMLLAIAESLSD